MTARNWRILYLARKSLTAIITMVPLLSSAACRRGYRVYGPSQRRR